MIMPGFTADKSLESRSARYAIAVARALDHVAARLQMTCGDGVKQLKRQYRDLSDAVGRRDWYMVDVLTRAIRLTQQGVDVSC